MSLETNFLDAQFLFIEIHLFSPQNHKFHYTCLYLKNSLQKDFSHGYLSSAMLTAFFENISLGLHTSFVISHSNHCSVQLRNISASYVRDFKDNLMHAPPTWFLSFVYCEFLVQLPFFFVATYAFWKGECR